MKRPLVVVTRATPMHTAGGMEAVAWDIATALAKRGTVVTVLTTSLHGQPECFERDGVCVVALRDTPEGRYSGAWWRASKGYFIKHLLPSAPSVLSVSAGAFALLDCEERRESGSPIVMQAHGTSYDELLSKWRTGRPKAVLSSVRNLVGLCKDLAVYNRFDAVVAIGSSVREGLRKFPISSVLNPDKVHLIPNGIDSDVFAPNPSLREQARLRLGLQTSTPVILTACRLHRQKGVHVLIDAFKRVNESCPDAHLIIAGDGPERADLESRVDVCGLRARTHFVGHTARERMPALLCAADVFAFPTLRVEGLPLNLLESLACGLPTITSAHLSGLPDVSALHRVPTGDVPALAEALKQLLDGVTTRRMESLLPIEYTLKHCVQRYAKVLKLD